MKNEEQKKTIQGDIMSNLTNSEVRQMDALQKLRPEWMDEPYCLVRNNVEEWIKCQTWAHMVIMSGLPLPARHSLVAGDWTVFWTQERLNAKV